ncbi:hypothetical protein D7Y13_22555 [Corallococcus praedator]|uniref:PDZ domain-containing protein n=1 Tax=Corallococcus praedator TaxID=2316724 RepID=A0ABX9QE00_9BACT|nr:MULTISPECIES: hypothetical protein [Corallococcus]RKH27911.1 hypothetical protein D7X75_25725 [Corallococcus sp. CA031C]RKI03247.1 hypothetical protein D7Y13_22555 [Corallococcus praedator]
MPAVSLLLSAATSLFTTTWLLAAAPFTVTVEPVGLSVRSDGDEVVVTRVVPGSPAALEGMKSRMRIERIHNPIRLFSQGPLMKLDAEDLQAALTPTWGEPLVLTVGPQGKKPGQTFTLRRTDPAPRDEFPVLPLPDAQVRRLTVNQQSRYSVRLSQFMSGQPAPPRKPSLELQQEDTTVWVTGGQLRVMDGGGFTGQWVHPRFILKSACPLVLEKLEVSGPGPGVPRTLRLEPTSRRPTHEFRVDLPLWSHQDVTKACAAGRSELTASLAATLSCAQDPILKKTLPVKLALTCEQPLPPGRSDALELLVNRSDRSYLVGAKAVLTLDVLLSTLFPPAASVAMVQVDTQGRVIRRFTNKPVPADARAVSAEVTIDTQMARTVRLAAELKFADGSTRLTAAEEVTIRTPEQLAQHRQDQQKGYVGLMEISDRLRKELKSACADPDGTVAWLQQQPEVASAANHEGHSISYMMKDSGESLSIMCHRR